MTEGGFDEGLIAAVMAVSRALVAMAATSIEASPVEVTLSQYRALVVVATATAPVHMTDLGRALGLSASSTTRLVERLERKELAARAHSEASRRSVEVRLQPKGIALVETVMRERRVELERRLSSLSKAQQSSMRSAFERFAKAMGEPLDVPARVLGAPSDR